jgi:VWFA-related protein
LADQYLHQLATKTGGRLYKANDQRQLSDAFSKIAEELRHQYSLGYYPQTTLQSGERREIKVRVDQTNVAVRARDSYVQRVTAK